MLYISPATQFLDRPMSFFSGPWSKHATRGSFATPPSFGIPANHGYNVNGLMTVPKRQETHQRIQVKLRRYSIRCLGISIRSSNRLPISDGFFREYLLGNFWIAISHGDVVPFNGDSAMAIICHHLSVVST